ncbi:spore coat protein CotH [Pseudoflavitalea sp. G-6-1-2]|uniref:CotH kinase family protein n=1 Tax=Pseudoflavitalea sp. G-6-1-2 TaxID=2728841 RepID=UPI00146E7641|nr:CotH kinase family protein [Pseudoflavitalea sp. G-6-1-2]NML19253.1 spore coat protein CotH [Pseudoflavitalea sp. G-6-1-2]
MRTFYLLPITIALALFSAGCKKSTKADSSKELLSFKLEAALNQSFLKSDITAKQTDATFTLEFPFGTQIQSLIPSFTISGGTVTVNGTAQKSGASNQDFTKRLLYTVTAADGTQITYTIVSTIKEKEKVTVIPHLYIDTENSDPINSKDVYRNAKLVINGMGVYKDYEGTTKIKGRGNTTWDEFPKKPYRLKLDKAAELLGLSAEKDWILLANYMDYTLMLNAIAMKTGKLLDMPYTYNIIPVDVTINGKYAGNYMFTEHKEVEKNRIDVKDGGVLLELDSYFDEPYKFYSSKYSLPVMIQYPELADMAATERDAQFQAIKNNFTEFENAVYENAFPNNNYLNYIDANSLVRFFIVYNLCQNEELNHPKSVYLHQHKGGKYNLGPIWDFDWAFDYEGKYQYFTSYTKNLFWTGSKALEGTRFFSRFMLDPAIKSLYKTEWNRFKSEKFASLLAYLDEYAILIEQSQKKDYEVWKKGSGNFKSDVQKLRTWLQNRASYMDGFVAAF